MELTKIEVAKHQLQTAIELFFANGDAISVYSLASNAWEIIDALCTRGRIDSISNETREHIIDQNKDLKRHYINSPYRNFFKHADQDPGATLDGFDDVKCDPVLFLASEDYIRLNRASPLEMQVYQLWYLSLYTQKIAGDSLDRVIRSIAVLFPEIRQLTRPEQKALGQQRLLEARSNPDLLADPLVQG